MKTDNSQLPKPPPSLPENYDVRREAWLTAYAETSCQMVEALAALLANGSIRESTPEYSATVTALYVTYSRPFCRCAGVGHLEKSDMPSGLHEMHNHLLTFRHKVCGHKDSSGIVLDEDYTANEVRAIVDRQGHMRYFCTEFYTRPPKMETIRTHAEAVREQMSGRMRELNALLLPEGKLANGEYLYDGEFVLSLDWREDVPFKRAKHDDTYVHPKH